MYSWITLLRCGVLLLLISFVVGQMLASEPTTVLDSEPTTMLDSEPTTMLDSEPTTTKRPWPEECKEYGCACDPDCARYGDCCRSSSHFKQEEQLLGASPFQCQESLEIYVIKKCPRDWEDPQVRNQCENPQTSNGTLFIDPALEVPVTNIRTSTTYQNWDCASCNRDLDANTTVIWELELTCIPDNEGEAVGLYVTQPEYISYDTESKSWVYKIPNPDSPSESDSEDSNEGITAHCRMSIKSPEQVKSRRCAVSLINNCSEGWKDRDIEAQCEAYTDRKCAGNKVYRNLQCALCNNEISSTACHGITDETHPSFPRDSFTVLVDWKAIKKRKCASKEIYDPFSRVCRKVFS